MYETVSIVEKLNGKKILIWGYGREGKATESFLKRCCEPAEVAIFEGNRADINEEAFDYIIKSPGIVMKEEHPKYTSQTELFLEEFRDRVIGVTGTKGKSTTSAMLHKVLGECCGKKVILLGNIGLPCLDYFEEITEDTIVVFEMSCHQLAHNRVSPHIAVFLNLYEEHLDYYGTVDAYFQAKSNITRFQEEGDTVFLGENVPYIETKAKRVVISPKDVYRYKMHIMGEHNQYNAEFVHEIAVDLFGCEEEKVRESLATFEGLPHRLQYIGEVAGVRFYDDSISTIPEASISAVNSITDLQTILIGGMDRGINYDILIAFIRKRKDVQFICMYESGKRIYDAVGKYENCFYRDDLEQAVVLAKRITLPGKACVLSPAAASYGYFKNFEERGEVFGKLCLNT
ncbi:MAG: UDP-N-acetylmuramoyl-L-alanine--D-glutamate ligase [Lachnospiraceae bacterium]|nr:UDP-N-acetylmuramoyl-L-alanine--D-glutamate ligase [Lachnospiraceae bacterium]